MDRSAQSKHIAVVEQSRSFYVSAAYEESNNPTEEMWDACGVRSGCLPLRASQVEI
jgi:hypothetical protein